MKKIGCVIKLGKESAEDKIKRQSLYLATLYKWKQQEKRG